MILKNARLALLTIVAGFPLLAMAQTVITNGVQTYATLSGVTVTMSNRCELRVTSATAPLTSCTINLNSPDAWLFLTGVKPSVVASTYLSQIKITNGAAVADSNCRVVQYGQNGAVVIPQSSTFQPLTVFGGAHFTGASAQFSQWTYYTGSGIASFSSFKLKRGYQAVLAQSSDGKNWSKCYVAQDGDLEIGVLPATLDKQVQFIYVTPWRWTSKKGIAGNPSYSLLNVNWWYDYNIDQSSSRDLEYAAIRQTQYWPGLGQNWQSLGVNTVLGYNEPDQTTANGGSNLTTNQALSSWGDLLGTGLRVGSPATTDGGPNTWLIPFVSEADAAGLREDYVTIHYYQSHSPTDPSGCASQMYSFLLNLWNNTHRPIWVTEWNNGANWTDGQNPVPTYAQQQACISAMINMLESTPFVERYALYNWVEDGRSLVNSNGVITPAGTTYSNLVSSLAYSQAMPDNGTRSLAQFSFETNTLDTSGYGNNGLAVGAPAYAVGHNGQAVVLDGTNNYIQLPANIASSNSFTFAAWVYWNGGNQWQRIFDFGAVSTTQGGTPSQYMFLTPNSGSGTLRFAINNGGGEQIVERAGALAAGSWQHVAVTLTGSKAILYVNGLPVATNSSLTITPSAFAPIKNYLGTSQFAADPLFSGKLDEVEIADYAFTPAQIALLQTNSAPQFSTNFLAGAVASRSLAYSNSLAGNVTDANGGSLTFSKLSGPAWLSVSAGGILTGTPTAGDVGTNFFTVRVTDPAGASAFTVLTINTVNNPAWVVDASGNWSDTSKWLGGLVASGAGITADFSTLNITADRTVTLDSSFSLGALIFGDTSGAQNWILAASGGSVLTLDSGSGTPPSITVTNSTATISAPLFGANGFSMAGQGTLILSSTNALTGTVSIGGGAVRLNQSRALENNLVNLACAGTNALRFGAISAAAIGGLSGIGDLWLTNTSLSAVTLTNGANNASSEYAGALRGSGGIVKAGTGTLTLDGTNAYTGATAIAAGTVKFGTATNITGILQPVLWFNFDAAGNGVVTNLGTGGWALNGAIIGSGAYITNTGRFGNALYLDGNGTSTATNIVLIPNKVVDTSVSGSWSVGYWIKTTTAGAVILYQGDGTWSSSGQTTYYLNAGSSASGGTHAGAVRYGGNWLTGSAALNDGVWHFITLVDTAGTETIYVDGNSDSVTATMSGALASGANQIWIGGSPDGGDGAVKMTGLIDEVCVFARALSLAEIRAIYTNAPVAGKIPAASAVSVASGATLNLSGISQTAALLADFGGGGIVTNAAAVPVTLTIGNNSVAANFSGEIDDASSANAISLVKTGTSQQTLGGTSHYRGTTTISNGTLFVNGSLNTNAVAVRGGILAGNGTIFGPVTVYTGGIISPGSNTVGALTIFNSTLTLGGTAYFELNKGAATNDTVSGLTAVNYGGTLTVNNLSGALAAGDTFKLFNAASYNGSFATLNLPSLGTNLVWNTAALTNGSLAVAFGAVQPQFALTGLAGTNLVINISGGAAGSAYSILTSPDLSVPLTNWSLAGTGTCDNTGSVILTNGILSGQTGLFYLIRIP